MSIVKILVPVAGSKRDGIALATAFQAAKPFAAHVEVLFVHADPREAIPYSEMPLTPDIVQSLVDSAEEMARAASKSARTSLATVAAEQGVAIVVGPQKAQTATASYREVVGHLPGCLWDAAMLSDVVVFPPIADSDVPEIHDAFIRILTGIQRPVLLSPELKPGHIGRNVAVGWDGRGAAAHALVSALPFLEKAQTVDILSVRHAPSKDHGIDDCRGYLTLHGIDCAERNIEPGGRPIAEVLVDTAINCDCDLLVVGGYGHSRMRESIFGGVTASIVSHPRLPILMVH